MHLFILICGIVLLPKAYALKCHKCVPGNQDSCTVMDCPSRNHQCASMRIATYVGDSKLGDHHMKTCVLPEQCIEESLNFGHTRNVITTKCCGTDLCNTENAAEHRRAERNGRKCYYCDAVSCGRTLNCEGNEDHCISKTVTSEGKTKVMKGCASKHKCSRTKYAHTRGVIEGEIHCCEGDFCNSASSTRAGLLLLVAPLLSLAMFS